jgi:hypothetical protein
MIRESLFYKILSGIHIVFFTSLLFFATILFSATILFLPALGAVFLIGKDVINKDININDSIIRTYCCYLKQTMKLLKLAPVNLVMVLNIIGMLITAKAGNLLYSLICLALAAFLLVLMLYISGYYVFMNETVNMIEVTFIMFLKLQFLIPVYVGMICCICFFSNTLLLISVFSGTFFIFAVEVVIFIQLLYYKKLTGILEENDKFAYLVSVK